LVRGANTRRLDRVDPFVRMRGSEREGMDKISWALVARECNKQRV
jgi:hypothetical protein